MMMKNFHIQKWNIEEYFSSFQKFLLTVSYNRKKLREKVLDSSTFFVLSKNLIEMSLIKNVLRNFEFN